MHSPEADPRKPFFDRIAASWDALGEDYTRTESFRTWLAQAGALPGRAVLEVGCGTGLALPSLCQAVGPAGRVVALDLSEEMLAQAKARCAGLPLQLCQGEAKRLPFADAGFDFVFIINAFPHLEPRQQVLEEFRRILRSGGRLTITHFCGRAFINQLHREVSEAVSEDVLPPASELAQILQQSGFRLLRCLELENSYDVCVEKISG